MANLGPESSPTAPPPPPPPPPAPPMMKMAAPKKKEDSLLPQTQEKIESLTITKQALLERIAAGDKKAEEEYDNLKKKLTDELSQFNKEVVSVIEAKVKALEETVEEQTTILSQETNSAENRIAELERQSKALTAQKEIFSKMSGQEASQFAKEIEITLMSIFAANEATKAHMAKAIPSLQDKLDETKAQLTKAKQEKLLALNKREQLTAISKALPARVKVKEDTATKPAIDFHAWIETGLLGGIYLQKLKEFIQATTDAETITKYNNITNPERKMFAPLSLNVVLAIASGYITRSVDKRYNETTPLKEASIDSNKKWLLAFLADAFYQANPALRASAEQTLGVKDLGKEAFLNAFVLDLEKQMLAAAPKATPVHAPTASTNTHLQLPAFALKKAQTSPKQAQNENVQIPIIAINPGQGVLKRALPPSPQTKPAIDSTALETKKTPVVKVQ